ncbi:hypothetical protein EVAR_29225_1 [Eumeta japonica]|uniref:Uncharacterized protein n=1 Tax=Eumeta variegata TaxID=151549 RepID=A0A4C1VIE4_EUMVA|nr:hypothetical protein EVAR_29225_1 [Eumeta japonica]
MIRVLLEFHKSTPCAATVLRKAGGARERAGRVQRGEDAQTSHLEGNHARNKLYGNTSRQAIRPRRSALGERRPQREGIYYTHA